ncbi:MAG: hypothetical protein KGY70_04475, partial [Bacteroidales bacterium]|nr:hypothetical protein [Bacteroidales bacterium]
ADDVGPYSYSNGISDELGHGRLNACNALMEAIRASYISGNSFICNTLPVEYFVENFPSNSSLDISWSVNPSNLFTNDNDTGSVFTTAWNGSAGGNATITATLSGILYP